ncbi:cobyrinate a,c-diamide synthase [Streptomyces zagrosensis]|uniref:Hydrogenobyrinate a,c-diamide synthase n=1 Tax=Streptomyces zagrosensis TaxID=1042984 RepID=A0A7W9UWL7_9ACTN|nr:cobyrinate a,c-diamide synthase [Streptomyces zagrosensis]MBB5933677.1 cobyrinic acid a,c-diamide synthase [Streptomyces zagrosensis]
MVASTITVPRLVIAAPASGSGKTTVATGLMAAYAARGLAVSPHKVGPDYIDPGYHALATGRPGRNLDAYLCGQELLPALFAHGARGADLAVVEGVMGLYDGAAGQGELASTAQVAKVLRAPVVLVVDASSQSRSVAALVHGFASFDPAVRVAGVILNKVGSDRHEELLRDALAESGVPVYGALRRVGAVHTPSRHLGLIPVAERRAEAVESVAALAERVRAGCDLAGLLELARSAPPLPGAAWDPAESLHGAAREEAARGDTAQPGTVEAAPFGSHGTAPAGLLSTGRGTGLLGTGRGARPVVAIAGGSAFTFSYAEHAELLTAAGADVVTFDPLRDEQLPDGTSGLVIGGGFPEMYAAELSANEPLRAAVAALAASGASIAAECAGLLYLARSLDPTADGEVGTPLPMCGVLPAEARMSGRLTLGYREAVALSASPLLPVGARVRGHEFHRTVITPSAGAGAGTDPVRATAGAGPTAPATPTGDADATPGHLATRPGRTLTRPRRATTEPRGAAAQLSGSAVPVALPAWGIVRPSRQVEGFVHGGVHASYLHLHWTATPTLAASFVAASFAAASFVGNYTP